MDILLVVDVILWHEGFLLDKHGEEFGRPYERENEGESDFSG